MKLFTTGILIGISICLLGIDFGTKYIKIALEDLKNGDWVIENEMS
jgi:hypothetical protein